MSEIADANALRGAKFKELLHRATTWIAIVICAAIAGGAGGALVGPVVGGAAFAVTFLLGIAITFWVADSRAATAFYESYAESRGLTKWTKKSLGGLTPLLRKGDKQRVDVLFEGELAPGIDGQLVLYTFIVKSRDSKGNETNVEYPFTLSLFSLPETLQHVKDLRVQKKSGFKALEKFEDSFRRSHERVTLESEAMRDRYEIFTGKDEDPVWIRRFFSPSFIVWLAEGPPEKFAFELENGWLCAYVPKHRDSAAGLDEMTAVGLKVAERLREESQQTTPATERETNQ